MKRKVVLGMAVFMTAIMVPAQAFAAKPTGGGDYLSGTQEAVESGDLDVNEAIATMMEGFEDVYYGTYNEKEGTDILMAFDFENANGLVAIINTEKSELVWACMGVLGEDEESEGTYLVYDEANDMKFAFTFEDETETEMTIGVEGGTLTLERQETDLLASFFETMLTGGFAQTEDGAE